MFAQGSAEENKMKSLKRGFPWGICFFLIAPVETMLAYAPYALGFTLLFSGIQLLAHRHFRVGSLFVGASLAMMLSAGLTGG